MTMLKKFQARLIVLLTVILAGMAAWLRINQLKHRADKWQAKARVAEQIVRESARVSKRTSAEIKRLQEERDKEISRINESPERDHFEEQ